MKTLCTILLVAGALAWAQDAPSQPQPDQVMFDAGIRFEAQHQPDKARLVLRTLALTYPDSPLAPKVKRELAALTLYFAAQSDLAEGRAKRAELSLKTLLNTFPTSPLTAQAEEALRGIR